MAGAHRLCRQRGAQDGGVRPCGQGLYRCDEPGAGGKSGTMPMISSLHRHACRLWLILFLGGMAWALSTTDSSADGTKPCERTLFFSQSKLNVVLAEYSMETPDSTNVDVNDPSGVDRALERMEKAWEN